MKFYRPALLAISLVACEDYGVEGSDLTLTYLKETEPKAYPASVKAHDPDRSNRPPSDYIVEIATKCDIPNYRVNLDQSTDNGMLASLKVPAKSLNERRLTCLQGYVQRPFVTLTSASN